VGAVILVVNYRCGIISPLAMGHLPRIDTPRRTALRPFWPAIACFFLFLSSTSVHAQCSRNWPHLGKVGSLANNPFRAEFLVTKTNSTKQKLFAQYSEPVDRDSYGRLLLEKPGLEFTRDGDTIVLLPTSQRFITICDPVAETAVQINTLGTTVKIVHWRPSAPPSPLQPEIKNTFCSSLVFPDNTNKTKILDLGDQTIAGVRAHGQRFTSPLPRAPDGEQTLFSTTDCWCSDELSAVVLLIVDNSQTGERTTAALQSVVHTEPDPMVFKIPHGLNWTVTETVEEITVVIE
jgi:hypothetical protein